MAISYKDLKEMGREYDERGDTLHKCRIALHKAEQRITELESQLADTHKKCIWQQQSVEHFGDGTYETDCGNMFSFTDGGVEENGVKYCQYCGKPIVEVKDDTGKDTIED